MRKDYEQAIQRSVNLNDKLENIINLIKNQEMHITTLIRCYSIPITLAKNKSVTINKCWSECGVMELLYMAGVYKIDPHINIYTSYTHKLV